MLDHLGQPGKAKQIRDAIGDVLLKKDRCTRDWVAMPGLPNLLKPYWIAYKLWPDFSGIWLAGTMDLSVLTQTT